MRFLPALCLASLIASEPLAAQNTDDWAGPVRLLIVMGGGTWENSVFHMFDAIEGVEYTLEMSDTAAFGEDLRNRFDAVLMYNLSATLPEPHRANFTEFLEAGGGLVVLHHALASYGDWPWWHESVVGGRYLLRPEGVRAGSTYLQDQSYIASARADHPVVAGLAGIPLHVYGETYKGLWISPEVQVLLATTQTSSDGPLVWVGPYRAARVVVIQPGHGGSVFFNHGYLRILHDAIHWTAGRL